MQGIAAWLPDYKHFLSPNKIISSPFCVPISVNPWLEINLNMVQNHIHSCQYVIFGYNLCQFVWTFLISTHSYMI